VSRPSGTLVASWEGRDSHRPLLLRPAADPQPFTCHGPPCTLQTVQFLVKLPYTPSTYYSTTNKWGRVFFWVFSLYPWNPLTKGILDLNQATMAPTDPGGATTGLRGEGGRPCMAYRQCCSAEINIDVASQMSDSYQPLRCRPCGSFAQTEGKPETLNPKHACTPPLTDSPSSPLPPSCLPPLLLCLGLQWSQLYSYCSYEPDPSQQAPYDPRHEFRSYDCIYPLWQVRGGLGVCWVWCVRELAV